jgi:hypothetical protein
MPGNHSKKRGGSKQPTAAAAAAKKGKGSAATSSKKRLPTQHGVVRGDKHGDDSTSSDGDDEGRKDKVPPAENDTTTNNEDANGTTNGDAEAGYAEHRSGMMVMAEENSVRATTMVREMVRNDLFRLIKFITKDEELGLYGKSAAFIAKRMGVKVDDRGFGKLWRSQKKTVKKTLDSKRSTTSMAVKQVVIRKWLRRVSTFALERS